MPGTRLTPDRILEEAEALADEVGLGQVRLAEVAQRLGVTVSVLYPYVGGITAVIRLMGIRAKNDLSDTLLRSVAGKSHAEAIIAISTAYRNWATRHPGQYTASLQIAAPDDPDDVAASIRAMHVVFDLLKDYGLSGDLAVDATRSLRAALHGFVSLEAAQGFGDAWDIDRTFDRMVAGLEFAIADWVVTSAAAAGAADPAVGPVPDGHTG
jgi:AcrR family transcriptional regulator